MTIDKKTELANQTVRYILNWATGQLRIAGCETPKLDAELLLSHTLDRERIWLHTYPEAAITPPQHNLFNQYLTRRIQREPVAYILGYKSFFGLDFVVTPAVLIPRPETELIIETTLELFPSDKPIRAVDVGTGSGCIAVTLAKYLPQATVEAVDISIAALEIAQQNAANHQVISSLSFIEGSLLTPTIGKFDLIVSNPPYLDDAELADTTPEIQNFEPAQALTAGSNGLALVQKLLQQAQTKLNSSGVMMIEIGSGQGEAVKQLALDNFPEARISIKSDLAGLDRMVLIQQ